MSEDDVGDVNDICDDEGNGGYMMMQLVQCAN